MTSDNRSTPPPRTTSGRGRAFGIYVVAWAALALLAAFYMTALALRPDLVSERLPIFRPDILDGKSGEPEGNQGQRAMSKALAEVQGLRQSVSQMQLELAKLKTDLGTSQEQDKTIATRIAQLEERVAAAQPALASATTHAMPAAEPKLAEAAAPEQAAKQPAARAEPPRAESGRIETGSLAPAKTAPTMASALAASEPVAIARPKVINAPQPPAAAPVAVAQAAVAAKAAPVVTTDAEATTLTSFGAPTVTPARPEAATGPIGLRISNGSSLDALRLSWSLLSDRHPAQLGNMQARYAARVPEGDGDPTFDLIAGPVKSAADAKRICKALAAKNIPCQIGSFGGPSL